MARNTTTTLAPITTALGVVTFTPRSEGGFWLALDGQPLYKYASIKGYERAGDKPFVFTRNERKVRSRVESRSWGTSTDKATQVKAREAIAAERKAAREAAKAEKSGADVSALAGTIAALRKALASGSQDAHLDALLAAEEAGKARKGAIAAIKARMAETATEVAPEEAPQRPRGTGRTLAANDADLADARLARVVATLTASGWSKADIAEHVLSTMA
jgi:hypothetical protein